MKDSGQVANTAMFPFQKQINPFRFLCLSKKVEGLWYCFSFHFIVSGLKLRSAMSVYYSSPRPYKICMRVYIVKMIDERTQSISKL